MAGIKTERARCARNCFQCPVCAHTLSVSPSDLGASTSDDVQQQMDKGQGTSSSSGDDWNPKSAQASIGEPPYYLVCSACKWDSKEIGMVFEKSTGLSLQVQRKEEAAADVLEFNQLRAHFEDYLKVSTDHQSGSEGLPSAARTSKLLRDVPALANDPNFIKRRNKVPKPEKSEELKPYIASSAWVAGRDSQGGTEERALGEIGKREQARIDFVCEQQDEMNISSLEQRWQSPADQSAMISDIKPYRVPLKTKQTKRCPACRHIIVKSEPKAQSNRFKIKLMALNYLPEIQIQLPAPAAVSSMMTSAEERRRGSTLLASRKGGSSTRIDEENLQPGRSYLFEASFTNPLDDAMTVQLHIAKHAGNSSAASQESSQSSGSPSKVSTSRADWTVTPTASSFPIGAFNEVWELDEEDSELLKSVSKGSAAKSATEANLNDGIDDVDELDDEFDEDGGLRKSSRADVELQREAKRKGDGIIKKKGHETTIGLELLLSREAVGDVEVSRRLGLGGDRLTSMLKSPLLVFQFAMQVTYHYSPDAADEQQGRSKREEARKSFTFWTVIRLGKVSSDASRTPASGLPALSTEARRHALDKRRSIMGINVNQSAGVSTLSSLRQSNEVGV
jgi:dynactin-4